MARKNIIFDMDGTLSNTAVATLSAYHAISEELPIPKVTIKQIQEAMGRAGLEFHAHILPNASTELLKKVESRVDVLEDNRIVEIGEDILFDKVYDMLSQLYLTGHQLHIASTGNEVHVNTTLEAAKIKQFFTSINHSEPQKKDMVARIIQAYGENTNLNDWMMVGDMFKDSEAAHANNITAVGAAFGYLAKKDHRLFDVIINEPEDIFNILKG